MGDAFNLGQTICKCYFFINLLVCNCGFPLRPVKRKVRDFSYWNNTLDLDTADIFDCLFLFICNDAFGATVYFIVTGDDMDDGMGKGLGTSDE